MICQHRYGSNWKLPFNAVNMQCTQCTVHQFPFVDGIFVHIYEKNNSQSNYYEQQNQNEERCGFQLWVKTKQRWKKRKIIIKKMIWRICFDHGPRTMSRRQEEKIMRRKTNATNCSDECNVFVSYGFLFAFTTHFSYAFWYGQTCTKYGSIQPTGTTTWNEWQSDKINNKMMQIIPSECWAFRISIYCIRYSKLINNERTRKTQRQHINKTYSKMFLFVAGERPFSERNSMGNIHLNS